MDKKRTSNFSNNEKSVLSELVIKYKNIIENKRTDATTNSQNVVGWSRLADEFNSICTECHRTPNNLRTCWENIKKATKKQVSTRRREMFMTGGGRPQPPPTNENLIVEAVLGPALEGLSNVYDCDAPEINEMRTDSEQACAQPIETIQVVEISAQVEGREELLCDSPDEQKIIENVDEPKGLWANWTPKMLKQPVAEPLRPSNSQETWIRRRRPRTDCTADALMKEKIDLVKILKINAEEEGRYRCLILQEQLKQEQIKTEKLSKSLADK